MTDPQTSAATSQTVGIAGGTLILLLIGALFDWISPVFAGFLALMIVVFFALWDRRREESLASRLRQSHFEEMQKALRAQRLSLGDSVIDGLPDPLFILNRRREVTHANRAARELFGRNLTGRDVALSLRHPQVVTLIDRALRGHERVDTEVSLFGPVNRAFHVQVVPLEAPGSNGTPQFLRQPEENPAAALSLHEVTDIRRAESMRADFVANASHELKTPLSSLIGFIETLQGTARDDAKARERFLAIMESEAGRMARLIDDLLSLSRIELDEHVPPEGALDLAAVIARVTKFLEMRAGERGITIVSDLPADLPRIQGDSDQLIQVFENLVDNAIKYGRENGTVAITAKRVDRLPESRRAGVLIEVKDEGDGIPPEHLPRLTERFYRVDTGRSQRLGGTGLGLAIVKHIIRRHRGTLDIQSQAGKGTTVTVGLPETVDAGESAHIRD